MFCLTWTFFIASIGIHLLYRLDIWTFFPFFTEALGSGDPFKRVKKRLLAASTVKIKVRRSEWALQIKLFHLWLLNMAGSLWNRRACQEAWPPISMQRVAAIISLWHSTHSAAKPEILKILAWRRRVTRRHPHRTEIARWPQRRKWIEITS